MSTVLLSFFAVQEVLYCIVLGFFFLIQAKVGERILNSYLNARSVIRPRGTRWWHSLNPKKAQVASPHNPETSCLWCPPLTVDQLGTSNRTACAPKGPTGSRALVLPPGRVPGSTVQSPSRRILLLAFLVGHNLTRQYMHYDFGAKQIFTLFYDSFLRLLLES